ncbi:LuxR C-terminal-related transcriptional regulator [Sandarakinorhabdus sp. DWP1-3-1]|uniref:LuxR C-terminal-related transcriptional regulator n=1 Tax=Sandarakinorhabdus sp. DWP1-3-1 TaxID=2804627 RepID=UPI003CEE12FB
MLCTYLYKTTEGQSVRWQDNPGGAQGLRLLVADRQPLVAAGLAALLMTFGHTNIATSSSVSEVRGMVHGDHIDIAVVDIDLDGPGVAAATSLPVIIIASAVDHPSIAAAIDAGCRGLVLRSDDGTGLAICLAAVAAGGQWLDDEAVSQAHGYRRAMLSVNALTPRERDVAKLVAAGQRNRTIGDALGISEGTVKMHLHNVYTKLGLQSRTQLAMDDRLRALG